MNIKDAKNIVDEMLDLCAQTEDSFLIENSEGIYRDVQASKTFQHVLGYASELMVFVNETIFDDLDLKYEIEKLYEQLQYDSEEFE
jgi:hypothetical protein